MGSGDSLNAEDRKISVPVTSTNPVFLLRKTGFFEWTLRHQHSFDDRFLTPAAFLHDVCHFAKAEGVRDQFPGVDQAFPEQAYGTREFDARLGKGGS
jgi:hypothetical protein